MPIFWLATQDHDFAEVSRVKLRAAGELREFAIRSSGAEGAPVGGVKLNEDAVKVAHDAAMFLGDSAFVKEIIRCYTEGETVGSAFGKLFASIFGRLGLILFDPSDAAASKLAAPILEKAAEHASEITEALLARGRELESAGYQPQVKVTNSSTLLFAEADGVRTPVRRSNGEFAIGPRKLKLAELKQQITSESERFSGNALVRPVIQDFSLPTLAYIGGPAEVTYFAQAAVVYEKLLGRVTPIVPRLSTTLLDARDQRLLKRHNLSVLDVMQAGGALTERLAASSLPPKLDSGFQHVSKVVDSAFEELGTELKQLDPTLTEAGKRSLSKMRYQLQRLRGRAGRALLNRQEELSRHASILEGSLYPDQELQEREVGGVSFLSQFGDVLLEQLQEATRRKCSGHVILPL